MANAPTGCTEMYLHSRGSGSAVLFLHGIPTSCHLWSGIIDRMAGTFTCMAVDLPGLGRSAATSQGFRELNNIVATIEALRIQQGIEKWHIVGHDAGCAIAVHYVHQFQQHVDRMALLTPSIFPDLKPFYLFEMLRKPILGECLAPAINLLFWKLVMRRALEGTMQDWTMDRNALVADFHAPFHGVRGAWRLMSILRWGDPAEVLASIPALLPELLIPTLIFHGSRDSAVPQAFATRASALMPDSQVILLDSGHFLPISENTRIAGELIRFFAKNDPPDSQWIATAETASAMS